MIVDWIGRRCLVGNAMQARHGVIGVTFLLLRSASRLRRGASGGDRVTSHLVPGGGDAEASMDHLRGDNRTSRSAASIVFFVRLLVHPAIAACLAPSGHFKAVMTGRRGCYNTIGRCQLSMIVAAPDLAVLLSSQLSHLTHGSPSWPRFMHCMQTNTTNTPQPSPFFPSPASPLC